MKRLGAWSWVLLLAGTLGAFATAAQPWWQVAHPGGAVPIPGNEASGALPTTLAAVLAAGVLLSLTLRGWGRMVLGALLGLVGIGVIVLGVAAPEPPDEVVARLAQAVTLDPTGPPTRAWGGYGFAAAGLVVLLGAAALVVATRRAGRPDRVDRFSRSAPSRPVAPDDDALSVWRALDEGRDPTAEPGADDHVSTPISPPPVDEARMGQGRPHRHGRQR